MQLPLWVFVRELRVLPLWVRVYLRLRWLQEAWISSIVYGCAWFPCGSTVLGWVDDVELSLAVLNLLVTTLSRWGGIIWIRCGWNRWFSSVRWSCPPSRQTAAKPPDKRETDSATVLLAELFTAEWFLTEIVLLGRVDLRVDHGHFRNHIKIQESPRADNPVRFFCICYGRHGGRPSQEQQANPALPT